MQSLSCPQCGGSFGSGPITGPTIECPYCHSAVIVPPELRPSPPPPVRPMFNEYESDASPRKDPTRAKIVAMCLVSVVVFAIVLILAWKPARTPRSYSYTNPTPVGTRSPDPTPTPYVLTFGGEGTGPGLFKDAQKVAVDGAGNIYVSDDTLRIQKFDSTGKFLTLWTLPARTQFVSKLRGGPDKLLADRAGNVYVVIGGVMMKYEAGSTEPSAAVRGGDYIYDVALKADGGAVAVSGDSDNDEMLVFDAKGNVVKRVHRFISSQLEKDIPVEALKVAVDGVGNIFGLYALGSVYGEHFYDSEDLAVFRYTADGRYVSRFGGGGDQPGQFRQPNAIAIDSQSRVYVCDMTEGIHVFADDGRFLESINTPFWVQGMAFDSVGDLFVVGNNKVSKLVLKK